MRAPRHAPHHRRTLVAVRALALVAVGAALASGGAVLAREFAHPDDFSAWVSRSPLCLVVFHATTGDDPRRAAAVHMAQQAAQATAQQRAVEVGVVAVEGKDEQWASLAPRLSRDAPVKVAFFRHARRYAYPKDKLTSKQLVHFVTRMVEEPTRRLATTRETVAFVDGDTPRLVAFIPDQAEQAMAVHSSLAAQYHARLQFAFVTDPHIFAQYGLDSSTPWAFVIVPGESPVALANVDDHGAVSRAVLKHGVNAPLVEARPSSLPLLMDGDGLKVFLLVSSATSPNLPSSLHDPEVAPEATHAAAWQAFRSVSEDAVRSHPALQFVVVNCTTTRDDALFEAIRPSRLPHVAVANFAWGVVSEGPSGGMINELTILAALEQRLEEPNNEDRAQHAFVDFEGTTRTESPRARAEPQAPNWH